MTRKDFVLIASVLRDTRESYGTNWDPNLFRACDDHAKAMASRLANTNPRFDRNRFLAACGVSS